jgi:hypothetical protein
MKATDELSKHEGLETILCTDREDTKKSKCPFRCTLIALVAVLSGCDASVASGRG